MRGNVRGFSCGFSPSWCNMIKKALDDPPITWLNIIRVPGEKIERMSNVSMTRDVNITTNRDFIPKNETARMAVEKARRIVKENHDMVVKLKEDSNIETEEADSFSEAANFSHEDSYPFDLYKIKSSNGISDFFKDIFGAF
jgi:hypothetical protein